MIRTVPQARAGPASAASWPSRSAGANPSRRGRTETLFCGGRGVEAGAGLQTPPPPENICPRIHAHGSTSPGCSPQNPCERRSHKRHPPGRSLVSPWGAHGQEAATRPEPGHRCLVGSYGWLRSTGAAGPGAAPAAALTRDRQRSGPAPRRPGPPAKSPAEITLEAGGHPRRKLQQEAERRRRRRRGPAAEHSAGGGPPGAGS